MSGGKGRGRRRELPPSGLADEILAQLATPEGTERAPSPVHAFADRVAASPQPEPAPEPTETWVAFGLAGELFALPVTGVVEAVRVETITRVPEAPFPVRGICNVRGQVIPVLDLQQRLDLGSGEVTAQSRILVVHSRGRAFGILVDRTEKVIQVARSKVHPLPEDLLNEQSRYVDGVFEYGEGLVILLKLDEVLIVDRPTAGRQRREEERGEE